MSGAALTSELPSSTRFRLTLTQETERTTGSYVYRSVRLHRLSREGRSLIPLLRLTACRLILSHAFPPPTAPFPQAPLALEAVRHSTQELAKGACGVASRRLVLNSDAATLDCRHRRTRYVRSHPNEPFHLHAFPWRVPCRTTFLPRSSLRQSQERLWRRLRQGRRSCR